MKKRIFTMLLATALSLSLVACGEMTDPKNNFVDADDAQRHIDEFVDESEKDEIGIDADFTDPNEGVVGVLDDNDENETEEDVEENEHYDTVTPTDLPEYSNDVSQLEYDNSAITAVDPNYFWISDDTFDLKKYMEACGFAPYIRSSKNANGPGTTDPDTDQYTGYVYEVVGRSGIDENGNDTLEIIVVTNEALESNSVWVVDTVHEYALTCYPRTAFGNGTPINIVEIDQTVDSNVLEMLFIVMSRLASDDYGCPMRGFDMMHQGWNSTDGSNDTLHDD